MLADPRQQAQSVQGTDFLSAFFWSTHANVLSPPLSDFWQNLLGIELHETGLIVSRRVKDQVSETKLYVWANLL